MPWEIIFLPAITALLLGFLNGLKSTELEEEKLEKEQEEVRANRKIR